MSLHLATDLVIESSAPARLCLGGEDLDWIGGAALLAAVDLPVSVSFERRPSSPVLDIYSEGALAAALTLPRGAWLDPTDHPLELARLCWQYSHEAAGVDLAGGRITIRSAVPPSAGLASSATACVAALRAVLPSPSVGTLSASQMVRAAYHVERELAGRPVGPMDFVPAAYGGTVLVRSAAERIIDLTQLPLPPAARFLIVDTRTPRDTGAVIAWKRTRLAQREAGIWHYAEQMRSLVQEQAEILAHTGDLETLGQTLNAAQGLLCHQLAVSTPLIDTCAARLRATGALGVKLTGTGLGGCLFALTTADADNERLVACLADLPVGTRLVRPAPVEVSYCSGP